MRFAGPTSMLGWYRKLKNELKRERPNPEVAGIYARHVATWAFRLHSRLREAQ